MNTIPLLNRTVPVAFCITLACRTGGKTAAGAIRSAALTLCLALMGMSATAQVRPSVAQHRPSETQHRPSETQDHPGAAQQHPSAVRNRPLPPHLYRRAGLGNAAGLVNPSMQITEPMETMPHPAHRAGSQVFGSAGSQGSLMRQAAPMMSVPEDVNWDDRFLPRGIGGEVYAVAIAPNGDIYAGGVFFGAGGNPNANYIARWDGSEWQALGTGLNSYVLSLLFVGNDLYVGGGFADAGGVDSADFIARWDGSQWRNVGKGFNNEVYSMVVSNGSLYAGGYFSVSGADSLKGLAQWALTGGAKWEDVGGGIGKSNSGNRGYVQRLAASGSTLYVGGDFVQAGTLNTRNIAKWTPAGGTGGAGIWDSLGSGLTVSPTFGIVYGLAVKGDTLFASGYFENASGNPDADWIAKWNPSGGVWQPVGAGINGYVSDMSVVGNDLYATGYFTVSGSVPLYGVGKWDGNGWSGLQNGLFGSIYSGYGNVIAASGSTVVVGGEFIGASGVPGASKIAKWTTTGDGSWSALESGTGLGLDGSIYAVAVLGNSVYVGGNFTKAGNVPAKNIARWNTLTGAWDSLGSGINGEVYSLAASGTALYAGGFFFNAGGVTDCRCVAKWTPASGSGGTWSALGAGVSTTVDALTVSGDTLYAGGSFSLASGKPANRIARWNPAGGTGNGQWDSLGSGIGSGNVRSIAVKNGVVYAAGRFTTAGGTPAKSIAKWNGTKWDSLGSGFNYFSSPGEVNTVAVKGDTLFAGGIFQNASGDPNANNVAKWNLSGGASGAWLPLGDNLFGTVVSMGFTGNDLYATGFFYGSQSASLNFVGKHSGSSWSPLGSGLNGSGRAIAAEGNKVYIGGSFNQVGGKPSAKFAVWTNNPLGADPDPSGTTPVRFTLAQNYPNPFNPETAIRYELKAGSDVRLKVFDVLGREVQTLVTERQAAGKYQVRFNASRLASGIYFYQLRAGNLTETRKMMLVK